jgi:hypothetical protein
VAEGAPLLREYGFKKPIEGSNPSLSARNRKAPRCGVFLFLLERPGENPLSRSEEGFDKIVRNNFEHRSVAKMAPKGWRAGSPE